MNGSMSFRRSSAMRSTCAACGVEFGGAVVADARFEGRQDVLLGLALDRDDEGKAEGRDIGGVELGEQLALVVGQRVEPGRGLLLGRFRRQALGRGELAGKIRMRVEHAEPFACRWPRGRRGRARCAGRRRCRARGRAPARRRARRSRRVLEDAAEALRRSRRASMREGLSAAGSVGMRLLASAGRCRCAAPARPCRALLT